VSGVAAFTYTITQTDTLNLPVADGSIVTLELGQGDKVQSSVTITNGTEGVKVYVEDPSSGVVYNGGAVYSSVGFTFNAPTTGAYTVHFDNLSTANQQTVEYSLTRPVIPSIIGIITIVAGAFLLLIGLTLYVIVKKATLLSLKNSKQ
jgi:hypothetical protein